MKFLGHRLIHLKSSVFLKQCAALSKETIAKEKHWIEKLRHHLFEEKLLYSLANHIFLAEHGAHIPWEERAL